MIFGTETCHATRSKDNNFKLILTNMVKVVIFLFFKKEQRFWNSLTWWYWLKHSSVWMP
jgi:hypothetical protein